MNEYSAQRPTQILVLETSSAIALMKSFNGRAEILEGLVSPPEKALFSRVILSDQVIYELTGILPSVLKECFFQSIAEAQDDTQKKDIIESYVRISARTGSAESGYNRGALAQQIRTILSYAANHPEDVMFTRMGTRYSNKVQSEHAMICPNQGNGEAIQHYRLNFDDTMNILGDDFDYRNLRVHAGQMFLMGYINEQEYRKRMDKDETFLYPKNRFYTIGDFLKVLEGHGIIDHEKKESVKNIASAQNEKLVTLGFIEDNALLPAVAPSLRYNRDPAIRDRYTLQESIGHGKMLIEHYLQSGIVPNDEESVKRIAEALHYNTHLDNGYDQIKGLSGILKAQGFYERALTIKELRHIRDLFSDTELPLLDKLLNYENLQNVCHRHQENFRSNCLPQNRNQPVTTDIAAGVPYEKVLSEATISGIMSFEQFFDVCRQSRAMIRNPGNPQFEEYRTKGEEIIVSFPIGHKDNPTIYVKQEGFSSRQGKTSIGWMANETQQAHLINGHPYWQFNARELLQECRCQLDQGRGDTKIHRILEAMLFPAVKLEHGKAPEIRQYALEAGVSPLLLLEAEKDFSNRHYRKWHKILHEKDEGQDTESNFLNPVFASLFASAHIERRIMKMDGGEFSTIEAALMAAEAHPEARVWICSEDKQLRINPETGQPELGELMMRHHAEVFDDATSIQEELSVRMNHTLHHTSQIQMLRAPSVARCFAQAAHLHYAAPHIQPRDPMTFQREVAGRGSEHSRSAV